jgi:hypothetical protein
MNQACTLCSMDGHLPDIDPKRHSKAELRNVSGTAPTLREYPLREYRLHTINNAILIMQFPL